MILLALLLSIISFEVQADSEEFIICDLSASDLLSKFSDWKGRNGRKYKDNTEEKSRSDRWRRKACEIDHLNDDARKFGGAFFAHNLMSDWTNEEFHSLLGARDHDSGSQKRSAESLLQSYTAPLPAPASSDWCAKGYCSPVKNQDQCGSCWAYTSTAVYESIWAIKKGLTNCATNSACVFSPQYLLDCNSPTSTVRPCTNNCWQSNGCNGGYIGFDYFANKGIFTLSDYPIAADYLQKTCTKTASVAAPYSLSNWINPGTISEDQMAANVAAYGPAAVLVNADNWQNYASGVMTNAQCNSGNTGVNHAVVIVGHGTDSTTGLKYWLIRNSWGEYWGEKGFIRMERGSGTCNIRGFQYIVSDFILDSAPSPPKAPTPVVVPSPPKAPTPVVAPSPPKAPTPVVAPSPPKAPTPVVAPSPPKAPTAPGASCKEARCLPWPQTVGQYKLLKCSNIPSYGMNVAQGGCIISQTGTSFTYASCVSCTGKPDCFGSGCPVASGQGTITAINSEGGTATITDTDSNLPVYIGAVVGVVVCVVIVIVIIIVLRRKSDHEEIV